MGRKHQNGGVVGQRRIYYDGKNTGVHDMQTVYDSFSGTPTNREGFNRGFGYVLGNDIQFRVYGAGGGGGNNYSGGAVRSDGGDGGYAQGEITGVPQGTTFRISVGKGGEIISGGSLILYGGGARPGNGNFYGGQGGGATAVYLTNASDLRFATQSEVIIVAGGGGGGGNDSFGGHGGGNEGENANTTGAQFSNRTGGLRGTQTAGGASNYGGSSTGFGLGAYSNQNLAGGGGGGWYGGSGGNNSTGGGGGSGYVGFTGATGNSGPVGQLLNVTNTVAGGSPGGLGNTSTTRNSAGNATNGTHGKVDIYVNGSFNQTLNYTGAVQTVTI